MNEGSDLIDSSYIHHLWKKMAIMSGLSFQYSDRSGELSPPANIYNGHGPCLQYGVARKFNTAKECIAVLAGLDYDNFKRLFANSNEYVRRHVNFHGDFGGSS